MRFTFSQDLFDFLCSDLSNIKVARAVTASSAVPVAFPTIVFENHAHECDVRGTREYAVLTDERPRSETQEQLAENLLSYRDAERRRYIHLVDGGISDNLGLRAMIDRLERMGENRFHRVRDNGVKNILVVLVNAAVKHDSVIEQSPEKPGASTVMGAYIDSQMKRYDRETVDRAHRNMKRYRAMVQDQELPVDIYFAEVSFESVQLDDASSALNNMPTSLELEDDEIERLITAGRLLLRHEPEFLRFKGDNSGRLSDTAISDREICKYFDHPNCRSLD
jgi:NTE family protein